MRLETAGYANVGKTNLHEFAYGITSVNPHYGTVPNPAYPGPDGRRVERRPAAALAAGLADAALGTDSGGSIRIPPRAAGSSASSRATGSSRSRAAFRSRRASITPGR